MDKMKHKISRLSSSTDQGGSTNLPKKQAKVNCTTSDNASNSSVAQCSSAVDGTTILPIVSQTLGKDVPLAKQTKEIQDTNMLETVRALLTCAVCLEVRNHSNQCVNGHLICSSCSIQLMQQTGNSRAKCPSCRTSLRSGLRRCLLAEQLADELPTVCHYCGSRMLRRLLHRHELETCPKRPTFCRFHLVGCTWRGLGSEMNNHTPVCSYRHKSIEEVEAVLVDNILRQIPSGSEERSYTNGFLNLLKKMPFGLNIFRRQIGVFRDPPVPESQMDTASIYRYQSENYLLQCCGVRRVYTLVEIDFMRSKLDYRLLNKSDGKASLSFRLCLVRCGDLEFNVHDQVHCMTFDDTQKETPTYSATITFGACVNSTYQNRKKLNNLIFRNDLSQLPPNLIQQSNALVLDFILLNPKRERVGLQINENSLNDATDILDANFLRNATADTTTALDTEFNVTNGLVTHDDGADSTYDGLRSFLGEVVNLPVGNRLRPLFNLIAPHDSGGIANNSASIVQRRRPRTTVITVTNLSETSGSTSMTTTGEDDEDEYEAPDSDASTGEGNNDELTDTSTDDDEDDNLDNCTEPSTWSNNRQPADRNNNALTTDEGTVVTIDKDDFEVVKSDNSCVKACTCQCCSSILNLKTVDPNLSDQSHDTIQDKYSSVNTSDERKLRRRNKRRISRSRSPMRNTCNVSSKRPRRASTPAKSRQPKATKHMRNSMSVLRRQSSQDISRKSKTRSNKVQLPSLGEVGQRLTDSQCKTPSWLQKLLQTMSQMTPYFVRNHLLVSPIDIVTPLDPSETHATNNGTQPQTVGSELSGSQVIPASMMSLRGDIPSEMMRWARTAAHGLFSFRRSRKVSITSMPNSASAASSSNGVSNEVSTLVRHQPKDPNTEDQTSTDGNNTAGKHRNDGSRITQRHRRRSVNSKRTEQ